MIDAELKGIIEDLTIKFVSILDVGVLSPLISKYLRESYEEGLDALGIQFNMNFTGNPARYDMLERFTFENIKDLKDEASNKLRKELSQSLLNLESVEAMKDRVKKVLDVSVDRARMIARTEMNRAENMGHLDAARESGLKLRKRWDAHLDNRTSPVCRALDGKTIGIDQRFKYEGQEFDMPPAHPNCRSRCVYIQEKSITELSVGMKAKYVKRTGGPGHYRYWYKDPKTGRLASSPQSPTRQQNKHELAKELDSYIKPADIKSMKEQTRLVQAGKDTLGNNYNHATMTWNPARVKVHKEIAGDYANAIKQAAPNDGQSKVVFMAGLPGAGKTFATQNDFKQVGDNKLLLEDNAGERYVMLAADQIKERLPEYNGGKGSQIVHKESTTLNQTFIAEASKQGANFIIDGTMKNHDKSAKVVDKLHAKGYKSTLIFVDVPVDQAMTMAAKRYVEEGRYTPYEMIVDYEHMIKSTVDKLSQHFGSFTRKDNTMPAKMLAENKDIAKRGYL